MNRLSYYEVVHRNEQRPCAVRSCDKNRSGLAKYCANHKKTRDRLGHPEARFPYPKDFREELEVVRDIFATNRDNPLYKEGLKTLEQWITMAQQGKVKVPGTRFVLRLADEQADLEELLARIVAVFIMGYNQPNFFPNDQAITFALAIQVIRATPHNGEYRVSEARETGQYIRNKMGLLLMKTYQAFENRKTKRAIQSKKAVFGV